MNNKAVQHMEQQHSSGMKGKGHSVRQRVLQVFTASRKKLSWSLFVLTLMLRSLLPEGRGHIVHMQQGRGPPW